jgi:hypothetical protein
MYLSQKKSTQDTEFDLIWKEIPKATPPKLGLEYTMSFGGSLSGQTYQLTVNPGHPSEVAGYWQRVSPVAARWESGPHKSAWSETGLEYTELVEQRLVL